MYLMIHTCVLYSYSYLYGKNTIKWHDAVHFFPTLGLTMHGGSLKLVMEF